MIKGVVQSDDLRHAAEWLDQYENVPGDDSAKNMHAVAAWLRQVAAKRDEDAAVRKIQREVPGVPANVARKRLREIKS